MDIMNLDAILGITSQSNACLSICERSGDIFYAAGSCAVRYSSVEHIQKGLFSCTRAISCLKLSTSGNMLAIGERGHMPTVTLWDIDKNKRVLSLSGHAHGIGCLAFSNDDRLLISIGFKHDRQLIVWDLEGDKKLAVHKIGNKVYSISYHNLGAYFITSGDRHLKFWTIESDATTGLLNVTGKPAAIIEEIKDSVFVGNCCGVGAFAKFVFCIASNAILCRFDSTRMIDKWAQVDSKAAHCITFCPATLTVSSTASLSQDSVAVGCANGALHFFSAETLKPLLTLITPFELNSDTYGTRMYPSCLSALCSYRRASAKKSLPEHSAFPSSLICCVYADRSLVLWDISDLSNIQLFRSAHHHRSCVWDAHFIPGVVSVDTAALQSQSEHDHVGSALVTCSADDSIRFWKLQNERFPIDSYGEELVADVFMPYVLELEGDRKAKPSPPSSRVAGGAVAAGVKGTDGNAAAVNLATPSKKPVYIFPKTPVSDPHKAPADQSALSTTAALLDESSFDMSFGIPDPELPPRPLGASSPRVLALHPYVRDGGWKRRGIRDSSGQSVLACGDRAGRITIYDINKMKIIKTIAAHSAEILTLHFSPPLVRTGSRSNVSVVDDPSSPDFSAAAMRESWEVAQPDASWLSEGPPQQLSHLVLLASAGRDRLIHVFEASSGGNMDERGDSSGSYPLISTLDHHSASVTAVRFTPNGQRLISCGGDHTMIISNVCGRKISLLRSIKIAQGTINNIAIDNTSKFAVASGQDKRLHIWNLHSGKHVREYKHPSITGELYKADIDPSGSYVAVCSFDKAISIFDFFSGDLVAQARGHSELITGVRFSPRGDLLASVSGDGCVALWKLPSVVTYAIGDRLLELQILSEQRQSVLSAQRVATTSIPSVSASVNAGDAKSASRSSPKSLQSKVRARAPPSPSVKQDFVAAAAALEDSAALFSPKRSSTMKPSVSPQTSPVQGKQIDRESAAKKLSSLSHDSVSSLPIGHRAFSAAASGNGAASQLPPPPPPAPSSLPPPAPTTVSQPQSTRIGESIASLSSQVSLSSLASHKKNRWLASRSSLSKDSEGVDERGVDEYELFGQKIVPLPGSAAANRQKQAMDFTIDEGEEATSRPAQEDQQRPKQMNQETESVDDYADDSYENDDDFAAPNEDNLRRSLARSIAGAYESDDGVMLMGSDVEDVEPSSRMNKAAESPKKISVNNHDDDAGLAAAVAMAADNDYTAAASRMEDLEKSARNLESWLEEMIRQESTDGVANKQRRQGTNEASQISNIDASNAEGSLADDRDIYNHITGVLKTPSEFRKSGGGGDQRETLPPISTYDTRIKSDLFSTESSLPPPPSAAVKRSQTIMTSPTRGANRDSPVASRTARSSHGNEGSSSATGASAVGTSTASMSSIQKRTETAAAISEMKEKLRGMGILGGRSGAKEVPQESTETSAPVKIQSSLSPIKDQTSPDRKSRNNAHLDDGGGLISGGVSEAKLLESVNTFHTGDMSGVTMDSYSFLNESVLSASPSVFNSISTSASSSFAAPHGFVYAAKAAALNGAVSVSIGGLGPLIEGDEESWSSPTHFQTTGELREPRREFFSDKRDSDDDDETITAVGGGGGFYTGGKSNAGSKKNNQSSDGTREGGQRDEGNIGREERQIAGGEFTEYVSRLEEELRAKSEKCNSAIRSFSKASIEALEACRELIRCRDSMNLISSGNRGSSVARGLTGPSNGAQIDDSVRFAASRTSSASSSIGSVALSEPEAVISKFHQSILALSEGLSAEFPTATSASYSSVNDNAAATVPHMANTVSRRAYSDTALSNLNDSLTVMQKREATRESGTGDSQCPAVLTSQPSLSVSDLLEQYADRIAELASKKIEMKQQQRQQQNQQEQQLYVEP